MTSPHGLTEPFTTALRHLAQALDAPGVEWRLGGSAMLAAIGLPVEVGDLDVTVPAEALDDVRTACAPWVRRVRIGQAPPPWCSDWIVVLEVTGIAVDVIGGLCIQAPSGRVRVPQDCGGALELDGVAIPLADPAVWWWVYRTYRPEKARALVDVVTAEDRLAIEHRLDPTRE